MPRYLGQEIANNHYTLIPQNVHFYNKFILYIIKKKCVILFFL